MKCPFCLSENTRVIDKRDIENSTKRRRECLECKKRFTTFERVEDIDIFVIKKDGTREKFSREKLKNGLMKACEKRPVSQESINNAVDEIERLIRKDEKEVSTKFIGELVMKKLKHLDKVAYIRFASVYRDFKDIKDFEKEIREIKK
ncbi:MAG: transcriptional regulator NrdR [Candidatus Pacearchaeota archaeon]